MLLHQGSKNLILIGQLKFLAFIGTSCEPEVTVQELGARKRKMNEDFRCIQGILIPLKMVQSFQLVEVVVGSMLFSNCSAT